MTMPTLNLSKLIQERKEEEVLERQYIQEQLSDMFNEGQEATEQEEVSEEMEEVTMEQPVFKQKEETSLDALDAFIGVIEPEYDMEVLFNLTYHHEDITNTMKEFFNTLPINEDIQVVSSSKRSLTLVSDSYIQPELLRKIKQVVMSNYREINYIQLVRRDVFLATRKKLVELLNSGDLQMHNWKK